MFINISKYKKTHSTTLKMMYNLWGETEWGILYKLIQKNTTHHTSNSSHV